MPFPPSPSGPSSQPRAPLLLGAVDDRGRHCCWQQWATGVVTAAGHAPTPKRSVRVAHVTGSMRVIPLAPLTVTAPSAMDFDSSAAHGLALAALQQYARGLVTPRGALGELLARFFSHHQRGWWPTTARPDGVVVLNRVYTCGARGVSLACCSPTHLGYVTGCASSVTEHLHCQGRVGTASHNGHLLARAPEDGAALTPQRVAGLDFFSPTRGCCTGERLTNPCSSTSEPPGARPCSASRLEGMSSGPPQSRRVGCFFFFSGVRAQPSLLRATTPARSGWSDDL